MIVPVMRQAFSISDIITYNPKVAGKCKATLATGRPVAMFDINEAIATATMQAIKSLLGRRPTPWAAPTIQTIAQSDTTTRPSRATIQDQIVSPAIRPALDGQRLVYEH